MPAAGQGAAPTPEELREAVASVESRGSATSDLPPLSPAAHEAAAAALVLLRHRARSTEELRGRLLDKEMESGPVEEALARLRAWGLLDDEDFAREWVRGRRRRRGRSAGALARELRDKGVGEQHISDALSGITERDERAQAEDLVAERLERRGGPGVDDPRSPEWQAERRRLVAFLGRRGYPSGMSLSVVDAALARLAEG